MAGSGTLSELLETSADRTPDGTGDGSVAGHWACVAAGLVETQVPTGLPS
jgi:hypothetical protein